jgi:hypothetical protein
MHSPSPSFVLDALPISFFLKLDHSNYVWPGVQDIKLLIVQFSPVSRRKNLLPTSSGYKTAIIMATIIPVTNQDFLCYNFVLCAAETIKNSAMKMAQAVTLLTYIREVSGSNTGRDIHFPENFVSPCR